MVFKICGVSLGGGFREDLHRFRKDFKNVCVKNTKGTGRDCEEDSTCPSAVLYCPFQGG